MVEQMIHGGMNFVCLTTLREQLIRQPPALSTKTHSGTDRGQRRPKNESINLFVLKSHHFIRFGCPIQPQR